MTFFESFATFKRLLPDLVGISCTAWKKLPITMSVGEKTPHKVETHLDRSTVTCYLKNPPTHRDEIIARNLSPSMRELFCKVTGDLHKLVTPLRKWQAVELAARLSSHLRIDRLLKEIQTGLCELLDAEAASILLYNKNKGILEFMVTVGKVSGRIEKIPVPMESVAGTIFQQEKTMIFNDLSQTTHFKGVDKASGFITRNILGSPIWREREKIGVIEVLNKKDNEGFTETDTQVLDLFAKLIGFKLSSVRNYENASRRLKSVILSIATAIDKRDQYTHQHSRQVTDYALSIGSKLGFSEEKLEELEISALLHDVGKIGIEDSILLKTGKLTKEEFEKIQDHPRIGAEITKKVHFITSDIIAGILQHHEKLDGSGYPQRLKNGEIDLFGRIIAVADVFDALTTARPYKDPWPVEKALELLEKEAGTKFDKRCVDALKEILSEKERGGV